MRRTTPQGDGGDVLMGRQHRIAFVHDWLVGIAGAEKFLEAIYRLYQGTIHTLVCDPKQLKGTIWEKEKIETSFLQKFPLAPLYYRHLLPLFPLAIEQIDLSQYDLLLSSSHAVAKGVLTHSNQLHICYCHTPMRYAWDLYHQYLSSVPTWKKPLARLSLHYLRNWDSHTSSRVDHFVANSHYIARRIRKVYNREATVIYPPVALGRFAKEHKKDNFYLTVSRMVPYKKIDLIVQAFSAMPDQRLLVVGDGPEMARIKGLAKHNIELLGALSDDEVSVLMGEAKAFVFAAEEDFGLVPVEAQAAGTPVIALGKGGALETVLDGVTGLFFAEQTLASLCEAVQRFEKSQTAFDPSTIRQHAARFSEDRFAREFSDFVEAKWLAFKNS